jgi:hypothetical protein
VLHDVIDELLQGDGLLVLDAGIRILGNRQTFPQLSLHKSMLSYVRERPYIEASAGRLLILSPWPYDEGKRHICRSECVATL